MTVTTGPLLVDLFYILAVPRNCWASVLISCSLRESSRRAPGIQKLCDRVLATASRSMGKVNGGLFQDNIGMSRVPCEVTARGFSVDNTVRCHRYFVFCSASGLFSGP